MKTIRISALLRLATVALLAICFNAGRANAQVVAGKFTLPFEAHWGPATLPPGDYSFTLDKATFDGMITLFRGANAVALISCQGGEDKTFGRSELVVVRNSAGRSIRELHLAPIGMVLTYGSHKPRRDKAAEEREVAQVIPIISTGK
jgi:hypothetical protein